MINFVFLLEKTIIETLDVFSIECPAQKVFFLSMVARLLQRWFLRIPEKKEEKKGKYGYSMLKFERDIPTEHVFITKPVKLFVLLD